MKENEIMKLITSDYSWEQVIYEIIAWEGLDPWDLDLVALSSGFMQYLVRMEGMDFKVPAKYVIIAAVLLRMKSDHLNFIDLSTTQEVEIEGLESEIEGMAERPGLEGFDVNPITAPPKRYTTRKIMVNELIAALRRALATEEKREKVLRVRGNNIVEIKRRDITERIEELYRRINDLLAAVKGKEVVFSKVVAEWKRGHIIDTFLPLIYLESQGRVRCRQDEVFDDIYISNEDENTKSKPMT